MLYAHTERIEEVKAAIETIRDRAIREALREAIKVPELGEYYSAISPAPFPLPPLPSFLFGELLGTTRIRQTRRGLVLRLSYHNHTRLTHTFVAGWIMGGRYRRYPGYLVFTNATVRPSDRLAGRVSIRRLGAKFHEKVTGIVMGFYYTPLGYREWEERASTFLRPYVPRRWPPWPVFPVIPI